MAMPATDAIDAALDDEEPSPEWLAAILRVHASDLVFAAGELTAELRAGLVSREVAQDIARAVLRINDAVVMFTAEKQGHTP